MVIFQRLIVYEPNGQRRCRGWTPHAASMDKWSRKGQKLTPRKLRSQERGEDSKYGLARIVKLETSQENKDRLVSSNLSVFGSSIGQNRRALNLTPPRLRWSYMSPGTYLGANEDGYARAAENAEMTQAPQQGLQHNFVSPPIYKYATPPQHVVPQGHMYARVQMRRQRKLNIRHFDERGSTKDLEADFCRGTQDRTENLLCRKNKWLLEYYQHVSVVRYQSSPSLSGPLLYPSYLIQKLSGPVLLI